MICAWVDTSSAVVGSSAMISRGSRAQRQRDDHALPHPAGELVRIVVQAPLRRGDAYFGEQRDGSIARRAARDGEMRQDGFGDLAADGDRAD